jgi:hypothetical protein
MSTMPDGLRNRMIRQSQVLNEHVSEKRIVGALCVVTLAARAYPRHITRYTTRDAIEQAARDNMIYCQHIVLTAIGALSFFSQSLGLAHSINRPFIVRVSSQHFAHRLYSLYRHLNPATVAYKAGAYRTRSMPPPVND